VALIGPTRHSMTKAGASTREIAAATGVDHATVARDRLLSQNATDESPTESEGDQQVSQNATDLPDVVWDEDQQDYRKMILLGQSCEVKFPHDQIGHF
jgi:hypothetical protein